VRFPGDPGRGGLAQGGKRASDRPRPAERPKSITKFLDRPIRWKQRVPPEAEADEALSRVQREVFGRLHTFVETKLSSIPRKEWMKAFE